jgi:hypothetical protein
MIQGEHGDGVLADGGLAAAGGPRNAHDLSVLERVVGAARRGRHADEARRRRLAHRRTTQR